jgi:hypothetical protein
MLGVNGGVDLKGKSKQVVEEARNRTGVDKTTIFNTPPPHIQQTKNEVGHWQLEKGISHAVRKEREKDASTRRKLEEGTIDRAPKSLAVALPHCTSQMGRQRQTRAQGVPVTGLLPRCAVIDSIRLRIGTQGYIEI